MTDEIEKCALPTMNIVGFTRISNLLEDILAELKRMNKNSNKKE